MSARRPCLLRAGGRLHRDALNSGWTRGEGPGPPEVVRVSAGAGSGGRRESALVVRRGGALIARQGARGPCRCGCTGELDFGTCPGGFAGRGGAWIAGAPESQSVHEGIVHVPDACPRRWNPAQAHRRATLLDVGTRGSRPRPPAPDPSGGRRPGVRRKARESPRLPARVRGTSVRINGIGSGPGPWPMPEPNGSVEDGVGE